MTCDLERLYGEMIDALPDSFDSDVNFVFSEKSLPAPTLNPIATDKLVIMKRKHEYNSWARYDALWFYAEKRTYRQVGLHVLSCVFHAPPMDLHLELRDSSSDIKNLVVRHTNVDFANLPPGYSTRPLAFNYFPSLTQAHPWQDIQLDVDSLPCFWLTNLEESLVTEKDWAERDTVIGFGGDVGNILFAEMILNIGLVDNPVTEFILESEAGYRGVGKLSAEARFFLPGSGGWRN